MIVGATPPANNGYYQSRGSNGIVKPTTFPPDITEAGPISTHAQLRHIKLPKSVNGTIYRRRKWLLSLPNYSSLDGGTSFMSDEEEGDISFIRTSTEVDNNGKLADTRKSFVATGKTTSIEDTNYQSYTPASVAGAATRVQSFRVEYHKRRTSLSSSSSSSGCCMKNSSDSSVSNAGVFGGESLEEDTLTKESMQKKACPKPTTLAVRNHDDAAALPSTTATAAVGRPTTLLSSPTSTAPPPVHLFARFDVATTSDAGALDQAPGRRRPTSLFMSGVFVPSMSSTTPALYTEAEGSRRLASMFENSSAEEVPPAHFTPRITNIQNERPTIFRAEKSTHRSPHTPSLDILDAAARKLSAQQREGLFDSRARNTGAAAENDISSELFSPTARGGDTLTATSPNTLQAFQSIADLASPTVGNISGTDPLRMVAAAGAVSANNLPSSSSRQAASPQQSTAVKLLTVDELASKMTRPRPFLLLDCRSALAFNRLHLIGAANINCAEKSSRKRLQMGRGAVCDLISSKETRALFRKRIMRDVIAYDDSTYDVAQLPPSDPLILVISALRSDGKEVSLLSGGFSAFQSRHSHLCEQTAAASSFSSSSRREQFLLPSLLSLESYGSTPTTPGGVENAGSSSFASSATLPSTPSSTFYSAFDRRRLFRAEEQEPREDDGERAEVSKILCGLYLGNERDAGNFDRLQQLKITHVVNITTHIPCHHLQRGITYLRLPASDSPRQDLQQHFSEAFDFIDKARRDDGNVLVHCQAGISRSATITVSYIMRACGLNMQEAYKLVKQKRSVISPNLNFMGQLYEYEKHLTGLALPGAASPAQIPTSSPKTANISTTSRQQAMELDSSGAKGESGRSSAGRPNSGKISNMVTQSIFEKKPASSAVMSPRSSLVLDPHKHQHISAGIERSSNNSNKRPSDQDYHQHQKYPLRAVKRPMSLTLAAEDEWENSTKSAPNTLQNEEDLDHVRSAAFGVIPFAGTVAPEASGNENAPHIHQSASVSVISSNSPNTAAHGRGTPKKIRSPLTPTNDYPTLLVSSLQCVNQQQSSLPLSTPESSNTKEQQKNQAKLTKKP